MSQERVQELGSAVVGMVTSVSVGSFLFEVAGALIIGIVGALGGYLFQKFIKPRLDDLFRRKKH